MESALQVINLHRLSIGFASILMRGILGSKGFSWDSIEAVMGTGLEFVI